MRRAAPSGRALTQPDSSAGWKRKEFAMTRYYFHTKDGADLLSDEHDIDLASPDDARARRSDQCGSSADRNLGADAPVVADEQGKRLMFAPIAELLPEPPQSSRPVKSDNRHKFGRVAGRMGDGYKRTQREELRNCTIRFFLTRPVRYFFEVSPAPFRLRSGDVCRLGCSMSVSRQPSLFGAAGTDLPGKRVLLIEDEFLISMDLEESLRQDGQSSSDQRRR
jgi:hypothetical protein